MYCCHCGSRLGKKSYICEECGHRLSLNTPYTLQEFVKQNPVAFRKHNILSLVILICTILVFCLIIWSVFLHFLAVFFAPLALFTLPFLHRESPSGASAILDFYSYEHTKLLGLMVPLLAEDLLGVYLAFRKSFKMIPAVILFVLSLVLMIIGIVTMTAVPLFCLFSIILMALVTTHCILCFYMNARYKRYLSQIRENYLASKAADNE